MKLLFYIYCISAGGAERVMVNLANQFATHGHSICFVTNILERQEYELDRRIDRVNFEYKKKETNRFVKNCRQIFSLRRQIKKVKPDIVISFMPENSFRAAVANCYCSSKLLLSVRNDPEKEYYGWFRKVAAYIFFRLADGVVFQTPNAMKWFPKVIRNKSRIILNQVSESFFDSEYKGEYTGIVTAGRLVKQKNHAMLIKAFFKVKDICNDNLIIYGGGLKTENIKDELIKLTQDLGIEARVVFAGETANLNQIMASAKMFVLSSDYEGLPNALMEAMALGLPCVSTDCPCGGPDILLEQGRAGILTPVGDEGKLAEVLKLLLSDINLLNDLAIKARLRAENFRPEKIFEQWNDYVRYLLNNK